MRKGGTRARGRALCVACGWVRRNSWVGLAHGVLSSPRRGVLRYNWELLRVERMLLWLEEVAKILYGLVDMACPPKVGPPEMGVPG